MDPDTARLDRQMERIEGKVDTLAVDFREFAIANERRMSDLLRAQSERGSDREFSRDDASLNRTMMGLMGLFGIVGGGLSSFVLHFVK